MTSTADSRQFHYYPQGSAGNEASSPSTQEQSRASVIQAYCGYKAKRLYLSELSIMDTDQQEEPTKDSMVLPA